MDVFRGEQLDHLREHVLQEFEGRVLAGAEDILADAPACPDLVILAAAAEPRVGGQRPQPVAGHFDFGNHLDMAFGGVAHDLANLFLRIIPAVRNPVVFGRSTQIAHERLLADGTLACQVGIFLDLDTPALVVGQMEMEPVEFMHGQNVDEGLHILHGHEMPADVEHRAAIAEIGFVLHRHGRNRPLAFDHQLAQALQTVEHPFRRTAAHVGARRRHPQHVFLLAELGIDRQVDLRAVGRGLHLDGTPRDRLDHRGEKFPHGAQRSVPAHRDDGRGIDREGAVARLDVQRFGYDIHFGSRPGRRPESQCTHKHKKSFHIR